MTSDGELDREHSFASHTPALGPETEPLSEASGAEVRLRELCRKVLGTPPASVDDNLLERGLHSLSAASLAWSIEKDFHVHILLSEILANPTIEKLLKLIEAGRHNEPTGPRPKDINGRPHPKSIPLSFAQEQVWFLEKLHPQLNSYRFQAVLNCHGALNVEVLEASLNRIVNRHAILRTAFVAQEDGLPEQEVRSHVPFVLPREDLRFLPEEAREKELQRRIEEELRRPFHLGRPPLVRWRLYQLEEQKYRLLHTEHHFVHDGWSYGVFLDELYATYSALVNGQSLSNEAEPTQFSDFSIWQREAVTAGVWDRQLDYWRRELAGGPPPPLLPSDRRLGRHRSFEGSQIRHPISERLWGELGEACSREGVTRFAWIQAVFHLFIHRYTGADDFCTGTGFANRREPRFHKMLGMAINTLPMRARFDRTATFRDLLRRTQVNLRFALDNQDLPFEAVVKDLNPARDANSNPFFNAFVACYEAAYPAYADETLEISSEDGIPCGQVKFDLVALLIPGRHATGQTSRPLAVPLLLWEFSSELFDLPTGERMLNHFFGLLGASIREPGSSAGSLPMAQEEEVNRILAFGRGAERPRQCESPIHRLFESVATATPTAVAVVAGETSMSYGELNARANTLAHHLASRGFGKGSIAAVALPRGPEALVCFLAILKVGGAYLPIDLRDPGGRVASLLRFANARFILTRSDLATPLPAFVNEGEVCLIDEAVAAKADNLSIDVSTSSPAYVLFTSGSTGVPKGVVVPHRAVSRLVFGLSALQLDSSEIVLHLAPLSFDASTFEIWGALLHGARVIVPSEDLPDFRSLEETILNNGITTTWLTSSLFNQIIDTSPEILRGLRQILTGGEALSPHHVRRALDLIPGARIINGYGPTETTTFATVYQVPRNFEESSRSVPIGRPLAGTQVYVLSNVNGANACDVREEDSENARHPVAQFAPIGVPGELYIGGEGVALGYMNLPELTTERFLADPFESLPGRRLYKTGDIVRWRPDGNLDFLGRRDDQIKIRGFRIEPAEIEAALERCPSIRRAVVRMWEPASGNKQLIAYYEANEDSTSEPADLLKVLGRQLPRYMIPASLIRVDKLPLTAAGKVDRLALPEPQPDIGENFTGAELTPTSQIVSNVWANVLSADDLSVQKSFFELGGDSLLALQVVSALRGILHIDVPVTALFNNPTIAGLSCHLDELVARNHATVRPPIESVPRDQPLPLSFAQERLWRNEQNGASSDYVNVILLDLKGDLDISCLERSLQELVRRHEVFRTTFDAVGDSPVQRIAPARPFRVSVLDLSEMPDPEAEAERFARDEKTDPISLEHGPLMRVSVLRLGMHHHGLVLKLHHILYDIWSLPIFRRELNALYEAFCLGKESPLAELTVHLADFAVWQRRYLNPNSSAFQAQLGYWRKQLSGNLPVLRLACERTSELGTASMDDVLVRFEVSDELSASLRELTKREGTTLFITFLTALKALINVSTGQNDIMLGIYMAKRNARESDRMMGYFCDLGVLRTSLSGDLSFLELLRRVRETVLNAHAYEDIPFDVLGEELSKCGQVPPDIRAIFMFEPFSDRSFRLGELEVKELTVTARTTMPWRLQVHVRDEGGAFSGWTTFDARIHDPTLVRTMMRNYVKLLEAVVRKPEARLRDAAIEAALEGQIPDAILLHSV